MSSFKKFIESFDEKPNKRGKQFEHFVKWFLKNDPEWSTQVNQIWLWDNYPDRWGKDCGIDLVFKHTNGEIWAVQAKCYSPTTSITKADIDTFLSESSRHGIDKRLLIATTDLLAPNAKKICEAPQSKPVTRYMLSHFLKSTVEYPSSLEELNKVKKKKIAEPRPHQIDAIASVTKQFKLSNRGQLIMACGTGKTYTTLWIKEKLSARSTLVLLPSLSLLSQTMREWTAARKNPFEVLCVCSDQSVGKKEEDETIVSVGDLGFPVTSDVKDIQKFIKAKDARVIFSTYHSSPLIAEAQKSKILPAFDLVIADEAHRCTGKVDSAFSTVLDNNRIRAKKRLFATATPRIYSTAIKSVAEGRGVEIVGMDDESLFGKVFYSLSFGQAISSKPNLLTDYQIVIIGVDNPMIAKWIKDRELLAVDPKNTMDAQSLAAQIGLLKAIKDFDLKRVISFHSRVNRAESFVNDLQKINSWIPQKHRPSGNLITDFVSGIMPTDKRRQKLDRLKGLGEEERGILSNARCLSEGVDVPSLDGVAFIDPRASQIDIIQAVGRAIRLSTNKKIGTIILPVFIEKVENAQASIEASNFKPIWAVLNALKAHDNVLSQELDQARTALGQTNLAKNKVGVLSKIIIDLPASVDASFSNSLKTYLVEQVTESWNFWYGLLLKYVSKQNDSRIPARQKFENYNLGGWVAHQRGLKDKLSSKKVLLLETLPNWTWDPFENLWDEGFKTIKKYVLEKGTAKVPSNCKYEGFNLGSWVGNKRRNKGKLELAKIKLLEALPLWSWDVIEDQWHECYEYLKKYATENGNTRVPRDLKHGGTSLSFWVSRQRKGKNNLTLEKTKLLESLPCWSWNILEDQWNEGFDYLMKYVKENGHARVQGQLKYKLFNLGPWVNTQRNSRETLGEEKIKLLEALPNWSWRVNEDQWNEGFELLKKYTEEFDNSIIPARFQYKGFNLGKWVFRRRQEKSKLSPERVKLLESLPKWYWCEIYDKWDEGIKYLKKYVKETGDSRVKNGFCYEEFKLGEWVAFLRKGRDKLSEEKIKLIEALPQWTWAEFEVLWNEGFENLKKYVEENGHSRVPDGLIYKNFKLSLWVSNQRRSHKKLNLKKIELLDALPGWSWDVLSDQWNEAFKYLLEYVKEIGHSNVPARYKHKKFNLGTWVFSQRNKKNNLSIDRIRHLEKLPGWFWPLEDQWINGFEYLKKFVSINGHSRVLKNAIFENFKLGSWVSEIKHGKNKLNEDQIKLLEALPQWKWGSFEDQWDIEYSYLKKFSQENGHSKVPARFEYPDFKLGSWVITQRKKRQQLTANRIQLLEALPNWSWNVLVSNWEEGVEYLKKYISEYGTSRVPSKLKYDGFNLAKWVSHKKNEKEKLSPERIKVLESLPYWVWE